MKSLRFSAAGGSMLSALGMQLLSKYTNVIVQLVVTMVLARLLTPEQYGTVAIVTVFTSFFAILADVGVSTAIIQYKNLTKDDFDALFLFCLLLGLVLAGAFCILAVPVALIYNDAYLVPLCRVASLSVLFSAMNMVPNGILLRERRFAAVSIRLVLASIVSGALAIFLAWIGSGSWALVWQAVASAAVILIWNCAATHVKLTNPHFVEPAKKIFRFSAYQAGFSTINYFARNLDNLLVGAVMGSAQLGQYDKAYKLMGYPINYLTGIFSDVLQPYLSEYQDKKRQLYESWIGICRVLAFAGMFVTAIFVCFPGEIVTVMYGDQWMPAAPAIATLGLSVGVQMVNTTSGAIFQSAGRTDKLFKSGLICTSISLMAILVGVMSDSIAVLGAFVSLAYFLHLCVTAKLLVQEVLGQSASLFLRTFLPSFLASLAAIGFSYLIGYLASGINGFTIILLRLAACIIAYTFVEFATGEWKCISVFKEMKRMGMAK